MLRLLTLGSLSLRRADEPEVAAIVTQPKRLALLIYLACATPRGLHQRDRILGMFWPEMDQERARAALSQSLYVLKKALGPDVIVTGGADQVGVDPGALWCDAVAFENALAAGDADTALNLYRGDFLPGFFLSDASGFEDWVERERRRLAGLAETAAWQLVEVSEAAGDHKAAIVRARRAFELSSHDESSIRRLLVLLDRAGDRAGALDEYERYARRLRAEFDAEPAPETQALVVEIRRRRFERAIEAEIGAEPKERGTRGRDRDRGRRRFSSSWARALAVTGAAALIAFAVWVWPRTTSDTISMSRIAVLPFTHTGASDTRYLSDGVVDLLATKLDGAGDLQAVDPHAMLKRIGDDESIPRDPNLAKAIAREFGAGYFLLGNITQAGRSIHLRAVLYDRSGHARGRAESTASDEGELFRAVDDVTRMLVAEMRQGAGRRLDQVAGLTTRSVPALKYYLEGEKARREGRFVESAQNLQEAIREDTTFALAHYRMALVAEQLGGESLHVAMVNAAVRHSGRLGDHDRRMVAAYAQFHRGSLEIAEGQYAQIVAQFPDDTESWNQLGELIFHTGPNRGRSALEAWRPFERVLELDGEDVNAMAHFARLVALRGDVARLRKIHDAVRRLEPGTAREAEVRLLLAYLTEPRRIQVAQLEAVTENHSIDDLWNWAARVASFTENPQILFDAAAIMTRPGQAARTQAIGLALRAQAFATLGQWRNARQEVARLERVDELTGSLLAGFFAILPFAPADRAQLEAVRAGLLRGFPAAAARSTLMGDLAAIPHAAMRHALLGLVEVRLGNSAAALQRADSIDALDASLYKVGQTALGVRAAAKIAANQKPAALEDIEMFRRHNHQRTHFWGFPTFNNALERYLRAELLLAAGREEEALKWFGSMNQDLMFNFFFFAPTHLRQAEILDRQGQRAEAASHYAKFHALWKNADPESQGSVRAAAARMR